MNATTPFEAQKCLIAGETLDNIVHCTNQCILITQPNFSHKSDAELTDKIEIKAFIGLLCIVGVFQSNKQHLEELWGSDRNDTENFHLMMNKGH
jgi:hypothetical protein